MCADFCTNTLNFKTLNYLGSKLRLLDFIEENVMRITPVGAGVCDLFAGSGCVSYRLSSHFPITSCDMQHYSTVICNALLKQASVSKEIVDDFFMNIAKGKMETIMAAYAPLVEVEERGINEKNFAVLADIIEHGSLEVFSREKTDSMIAGIQKRVCDNLINAGVSRSESFISRHYGGVYFSYRQSVQIDAIMLAVKQLANEYDRDVFLAALLSTASDIADTVGKHFAQPIRVRDAKGKIKALVYNKAKKDKTIDVVELYKEWLSKYLFLHKSDFSHSTYNGDYLDCLKGLDADVRTVYADPPYTRDHYSRFYHVLETIALGDEPEISTVLEHGIPHISNGIYRMNRHQSPFCIRSKAPTAFCEMFQIVSATGRSLLLSYSPYDISKKTHPRVVTMQQLVSWANMYFRHVEVVSAGHFTHSKLNSSIHSLESSNEAEQLIVCRGKK